MIKNLIFGALAIGALYCILNACASKTKVDDGKRKPSVAVSIPPQLFFIKAIAGDRVQAICLLANSSDPETFEPSMSQLVELEKADVFMPVGVLPFEKSLLERLKANNKNLNISPVSKGIPIITGTHGHDHADGHHHEESADPHVWSSTRNAKIIALNTLEALLEVDTVNEDVYRANYQRLINRLDSIDESFKKVLNAEGAPKSFVVWHPSLSYFAKDYGLRQVALETEGKEASVKGLVDRFETATRSGAAICFLQKEFDAEKAKTLSNDLGVKIVEINPMNEEWEDEMQKLYDAFTVN